MIFALSYNRFMKVLMTPLWSGPRRSWVRVDGESVRVRMGFAFSAVVPRASIIDASRVEGRVISAGAHGWRGRWLVNGSSRGLVTMSIDPAGHAVVLGFRVSLRQLTLSLEQPDQFLVAIGRRTTM